jgi:hypothetical protein
VTTTNQLLIATWRASREHAVAADGGDEHRRGAERVDDRQQGHRHQHQRLQDRNDQRFQTIS